MKPYILSSFNENDNNSILQLVVTDQEKDCLKENSYIKKVREKYWKALFTSDQFMGLFTSNLRTEFYNKVKELC